MQGTMEVSAKEVEMVNGRCDRCGVTAKARVRVKATDLHFCDHHFRAHRDALEGYPTSISEDSVHYEEPVMA